MPFVAWRWCIWALALAACAGPRAPSTPAPCPEVAGTEVERVCREDASVETLQARFRADVVVGGEASTMDGILLVQRPGSVRVKLFGPAGMTVHDALWVGDGEILRGRLRRPLRGDPIRVELRNGESVDDPEAELSLALWSLWRPRCVRPPTSLSAEPGWLRLDGEPAQATARDVRVGPLGVEEERLVRAGGDVPHEISVWYRDRDCSAEPPLPTTIEMRSARDGWSALVRILEQRVNLDLPEALFVFPEDDEAVR